jgi:hypothetical protein
MERLPVGDVRTTGVVAGSTTERGTGGSDVRASFLVAARLLGTRGLVAPEGAPATSDDAISGASVPPTAGAASGGLDGAGVGAVGAGSGVAEGAGCSEAGGGADAGGDVGAGGAAGAGGGMGAPRGGSNWSGST